MTNQEQIILALEQGGYTNAKATEMVDSLFNTGRMHGMQIVFQQNKDNPLIPRIKSKKWDETQSFYELENEHLPVPLRSQGHFSDTEAALLLALYNLWSNGKDNLDYGELQWIMKAVVRLCNVAV